MVVVQTRNDGNVTNAEARSMLNERRLSRQASAYMRKLVRCHGSELAQANINNDKRLREADEIMELVRSSIQLLSSQQQRCRPLTI